MTAADSSPHAEIVSNVAKSAAGDIVDVRVRLPASGDGKDTVLDEQWAQRNEVWYFQPERLRSRHGRQKRAGTALCQTETARSTESQWTTESSGTWRSRIWYN